MPYMRNRRTGEMVEVDNTGQPVSRNAGPPMDPAFPYKAPQAAANVTKTVEDIRNDRERIALQREQLRVAQQAGARADSAARSAQDISNREQGSKLGNLRALQNQIGRVRQLYQQGPGATHGLAGAQDYLPLPSNKAFDSASASLGDLGRAAFRVPGVGSQSDAELKAFVEANQPHASDYDAAIEEKLRNLENRLGEAYKPYGVQYRPNQRRTLGSAPHRSNVIDFNDWNK